MGDNAIREAAVLMALTDAQEPDLVFIRRAEHLNNHSGQVAFPGGMWEREDADLMQTALRESEEEIGLPPAEVEIIAAMEPRLTRFSVRVSPYVGVIPEGLTFVPELSELDAIFQVPLPYFLNRANYTRSRFLTPVGTYEAPCIYYDNYCIWGFTYRLTLDMLAEVFGFDPGGDQETLDLTGD